MQFCKDCFVKIIILYIYTDISRACNVFNKNISFNAYYLQQRKIQITAIYYKYFSLFISLLSPINATRLELSDDVGSDIAVWSNTGVPRASLLNKNEKYFWFHHSNGDTMTVENSDDLDKCLALWAAVSYVVADLSVNLSRV